MSALNHFPKIFHVGTRYVADIYDGQVEVTEKVDGSQFCFGRDITGELQVRSKGAMIYDGNVPKMFEPAVAAVRACEGLIPDGYTFYGETLAKPKHNTIAYARVPRGNIALFGLELPNGRFARSWEMLRHWADMFEMGVVPLLYSGPGFGVPPLEILLEADSHLGGAKIEGVVVKNYDRDILCGGVVIPIMCAKYVSEAFKEKHNNGDWTREHKSKGKWESFVESYRAEARWTKSVQHLREDGLLDDSPKDIGPLIKAIQNDIWEEEGDAIVEFLVKSFGKDLDRQAVKGFPEWYKQQLAGVSNV